MRTIASTFVFMLLTGMTFGQVSDVQALELIFTSTCVMPSHLPHEKAARAAKLKSYNFDDEDQTAYLLAVHCQAYHALIDEHNAKLAKYRADAISSNRDYVSFHIDPEFETAKSVLVSQTALQLEQVNPRAWNKFLATMQYEKENNMSRLAEMPMMPGQTAEHHHAHIPQVNGFQGIGNYSDYGYTVYDSFSTDGYHGWYIMSIIGASSYSYWCTWDQYHGQWQPPGCASAYHQPTVQMVVNGGNGEYENFSQPGPAMAPDAYMSWSYSNQPRVNNFQAENNPKPHLTVQGTISVFCSIANAVILSWPRLPTFADAYTRGHVPTNSLSGHSCPATPWCSPATTPPYYNFNRLLIVNPSTQCYQVSNTFWDGYETYVSYNHGPWTDTGVGWAWETPDGTKATCDTSLPRP